MKSVQNCTRFIFYTFHAVVRLKSFLDYSIFTDSTSCIDTLSDKIFDYLPILLSVLNPTRLFRLFSDSRPPDKST